MKPFDNGHVDPDLEQIAPDELIEHINVPPRISPGPFDLPPAFCIIRYVSVQAPE